MAVMQHSIIFGGVNSADYGIYIGGEGTFNAPQRDVEMISIPGRNGAFALDKGRFENIEVTYTAINQESDLATFSQKLEAFRNAICALRGYQRLEDTFHTAEYRMATYIGGLEISPIKYNTASEFEITFNCKPQRYLKSGETAVTVASGNRLTNPTLFPASPLLMAEGYGKISFNGYEIVLINSVLGQIALRGYSRKTFTDNSATISGSFTFDRNLVETGDTISVSGRHYAASPVESCDATAAFKIPKNTAILPGTHTDSNVVQSGFSQGKYVTGEEAVTLSIDTNPTTFTVGTASTFTASSAYNFEAITNQSGTGKVKVAVTIAYNGNNKITTTMRREIVSDTLGIMSFLNPYSYYVRSAVTADSTVSLLGHPTYIDCDIGEVYRLEGTQTISLNGYVDLGSKLPQFKPGSNTITTDNTITSLQIIPRWWKV